jgi:hypothetical protein
MGRKDRKGNQVMKPRLAEGHAQVVFLTLMVHRMCAPKNIHFVPPAMRPIEKKIKQHQGEQKTPPRGRDIKNGNVVVQQAHTSPTTTL